MKKKTALVFYYTHENRYSYHALLGALETQEDLQELDILFLEKEDTLVSELPCLLKQYEKVVLGISFCTPQLWSTAALMKKIQNTQQNFSDSFYCIAGGPHPTGDTVGTLKLGFDIVVVGEGEDTLIEFMQKISQDEDPREIQGIAFWNDKGEFVYNQRHRLVDLDKYSPFSAKHHKYGAIEITRGCPYACNYCQTSHLFGSKMRHRSVEKICEFMQNIIVEHPTVLRFVTPNAFSYGNGLADLEFLLFSLKKSLPSFTKIFIGTFPSEVRPDSVNKEAISLVKQYACNDNLTIGAQSGSQRMLDMCHRGHTVEDIYRSVELARQNNFMANVDFIFGMPDETEEDIAKTIQVMNDLVKMGAKIHAHAFLPLPQTAWRKASHAKITPALRKSIERLISQGDLFGNWNKQYRLSTKIFHYLCTGELVQ
ncbi:MAG: TIGR04013 family B12-binding domain/radical SAM domain-containing protein [Candidatus Brocadiae bacterium]|nr:TIGR04013 family B12-binding domain/radical SAM domain-containing protein [Candidatus Brocadiia bacterium]